MAPTYWRQADAADRFFYVRDPAGPFVRGFTEAFYAPFRKATGIRPIRVTGGIEPTGMMRDMVRSQTYTWDLALVSKACQAQLVAEDDGYLEKIAVDTKDISEIPERYKTPYFVGNDVFANVMCYRTDAFDGRPAPQSWADFWNVSDFPARRSLRRHPIDTFEQALLADGADAGALYPLDVARALQSLDRIRAQIKTWWFGAAQQVRLMTEGKIDLCAISSIRAQQAVDVGAPVKIAWHQGIRTVEGWCILKGTPKADLCREFIRFAATAERQAVFTNYVNSSPTVPGAAAHLPAARVDLLPDAPAHRATAVESDALFWSREKDRLTARFDAWF
jgi:putative spermidine/putrescine transport system substrate-binding protein